jgi:hypothetical protein
MYFHEYQSIFIIHFHCHTIHIFDLCIFKFILIFKLLIKFKTVERIIRSIILYLYNYI